MFGDKVLVEEMLEEGQLDYVKIAYTGKSDTAVDDFKSQIQHASSIGEVNKVKSSVNAMIRVVKGKLDSGFINKMFTGGLIAVYNVSKNQANGNISKFIGELKAILPIADKKIEELKKKAK